MTIAMAAGLGLLMIFTAFLSGIFGMAGGMVLEGEGKEPYRLSPGDAFVIPPGMATRYAEPTADLQLLEVTLPGNPATVLL